MAWFDTARRNADPRTRRTGLSAGHLWECLQVSEFEELNGSRRRGFVGDVKENKRPAFGL